MDGNLSKPNITKSKAELEKIKLQIEIDNLISDQKEKKKPWYIKNLGILIPSLIALATLMTGIFTGFFDAEKINLENQRYDLIDSIKIFQAKKLAIQKQNSQLTAVNKTIVSQNNKLRNQTFQLSLDTSRLGADIKHLSEQSRLLTITKKRLLDSTLKLAERVNTAPFDLLWKKFIATGNNTVYMSLRDTIYHSLTNKTKYLKILRNFEDTSKNEIIKGTVQCMLFWLTNDGLWKQKMFSSSDKFAGIIEKAGKTADFGYETFYRHFFDIIQSQYVQGRIGSNKINQTGFVLSDKKALLIYLINLTKKVEKSEYFTSQTLEGMYSVMTVYNSSDNRDLIQFIRHSKDLVYLLKICSNHFFLSDLYDPFEGYYTFLQTVAPVASTCAFTQIMRAHYTHPDEQIITEGFKLLIAANQRIINSNSDQLSTNFLATTIPGIDDWILKNKQTMDLFEKVSNGYNSSQIDRLIGNDIVD